MYAAGIYSLQSDWVASNSLTSWTVPGLHWHIGGIFLIALAAAIVGVLGFIFMRATAPAYFKKQTLTRGTPTLFSTATSARTAPSWRAPARTPG